MGIDAFRKPVNREFVKLPANSESTGLGRNRLNITPDITEFANSPTLGERLASTPAPNYYPPDPEGFIGATAHTTPPKKSQPDPEGFIGATAPTAPPRNPQPDPEGFIGATAHTAPPRNSQPDPEGFIGATAPTIRPAEPVNNDPEGFIGATTPTGTQNMLPDTSDMTDQEKLNTYEAIFDEKASEEAKEAYANNETVVLALRQESAVYDNEGKGNFDDRFIVMWTDENGTRRTQEFAGSLDPNLQYDDDLRETVGVDNPPANMGQYGDVNTDSRFNPFDGDQVDVWGRVAGGQTIQMQTGPKDNRLYPPAEGGYELDVDFNGNGVFDDNITTVRNDNAFQLHGPHRDEDGNVTHTGSGGCMTVEDENAFFEILENSNLTTVESSRRTDFFLPESLEQDGTETAVYLTIA